MDTHDGSHNPLNGRGHMGDEARDGLCRMGEACHDDTAAAGRHRCHHGGAGQHGAPLLQRKVAAAP